MMKRIWAILLSLALVVTMIPSIAFAETFDEPAASEGGNITTAEESMTTESAQEQPTPKGNIQEVSVAKIGDTEYDTLEAAVAAVQDGETISLLADCSGNGIIVPTGSNFTIDFAGFTYEVDGNLVGSPGTENNGFQLLKDSDLTFKNGTITSSKAKILIQNYSNLNLENMALVGNAPCLYTLSNNHGNVNINGCEITAAEGKVAFDVYTFGSYTGANVSVTDTTVNGPIELGAADGSNSSTLALTLGEGTDLTNSSIIMGNGGDKVNVTKADSVNVAAPAGYQWDADGKLVDKYVAKIDETQYKTLAEAVTAVQSGQTITLLDNCSGNGIVIPTGSNFTIDFAGYAYDIDGDLVGSPGTESNGFQLLKDSDLTFKNGTITSSKAKILIQNYSNLNLENMTLVGNAPCLYTLSNNNGDVNINGCEITAAEGKVAFDVYTFGSYTGANVSVTDTTVNGPIELGAAAGSNSSTLALTLGEGTNLINSSIIMGNGGDKVDVTKADSVNVAAPAGYQWKDGKLVAKNVARIGTAKYKTLAEAVTAVQSGQTITLLDNCSGNGIVVPTGSNFTIDFAGYTYDIDGTTVGSPGTETNGFQLLKDSNLTFKNGTITSSKAKILIQNYSNLNLENMTLIGNAPCLYTLSNNNGDVNINGCEITAAEGKVAFDVYTFGSYTGANVSVTDTTVNGPIELGAADGSDSSTLALTLGEGTVLNGELIMGNGGDKVDVTKADSVNVAAPAGYVWSADGKLVIKYVAKIGETQYATLEAAVAAVQDGQTITLLDNCSGNGIKVNENRNFTIDFNGKTYTVDGNLVGSTGTETNGFQLLKDSNLTFKNGTITSSKAKILIQNYSNLNLENMTLIGNAPCLYTLSNNNGDVNINGCEITAAEGKVAFDVYTFGSYTGANVSVTDTTVNGPIELGAADGSNSSTLALTLGEGTVLNGELIMGNGGDKVDVTKAKSVNIAAPAGYIWETTEGEDQLRASEAPAVSEAIAALPTPEEIEGATDEEFAEFKAQVEAARAAFDALTDDEKNAVGFINYIRLVEAEEAIAAVENTEPVQYVAKIGETQYTTLETAVAAVQDGQTITLLDNCSGNGIKVNENRNFTIDFNGKTYTVDGNLVGSTGTETNGFQLLKDSNLTFKNGTITSNKAKILIQNYSNLTLEKMTLVGSTPCLYTLSNNNGTVTVTNSTITAASGEVAFDVCGFANYDGAKVTVTNTRVNGTIELSSNANPHDLVLVLGNGTVLNGNLVMSGGGDKVEVTKAKSVDITAPAGYVWEAMEDKDQLRASEAPAVSEAIIALPTPEEIEGATDEEFAEFKAQVEAARAAFDALTDDEKNAVGMTNYIRLTEAEEAIDAVESAGNAPAVSAMIAALPTPEEIEGATDEEFAEFKAQVEAARAAFDALTDDEKNAVGMTNYIRLTEAEEAIRDVEAANQEAEIAALQALIKRMEAKIFVLENPISAKAVSTNYRTITLTWSCGADVDDGIIAGYYVNGEDVGKTYSKVFTKLKTGTEYTYSIQAYCEINGVKEVVGGITTVTGKPMLSKTVITSIVAGKNKATIKWNRVPGATRYAVYQSTKKTRGFKRVGTINKGSTVQFTKGKLTSKKVYYYKVRAYRVVDGKNVYGPYSTVKSVRVK